jgi:hypothetical protein
VVIVDAFIASLKVALTGWLTHTPVATSAGFVDATVGAVVSTVGAVVSTVGAVVTGETVGAPSPPPPPHPATSAVSAMARNHIGRLQLLSTQVI